MFQINPEEVDRITPLLLDYKFKPYYYYGSITSDELTSYSKRCLLNPLSNSIGVAIAENSRIVAFATLKLLKWDSTIFKKSMARIGYLLGTGNYRENLLREILTKCSADKTSHISCRIDVSDIETIHLLGKYNFKIMDILITLSLDLRKDKFVYKNNDNIRDYQPQDLSVLRDIAHNVYTPSRFFVDTSLHQERVKEMYACWTENSCNNQEKKVFIATKDSRIIGFIICNIDREIERHTNLKVGRIELIRVLPEHSGFGFGTSLVNSALNWFKDYVDIVEAGTEANNYAGLRIYQKCGFKIVNSAISFHRCIP